MSDRDITLGDTFDIKFTTRAFATGVPTTMAGSPTVSVYPGNSTTQITAGITLTYASGFDGVAGLCNVRVVATSGNGYAANTDYAMVLTGSPTVASVSVVGEVVGHFSTSRSAAAVDLANTTDGLGALKAETALIVEDTGTTIPATITTIDNEIAALDTVVGRVEVDTQSIETKVDAVKVRTDRLPNVVAGGAGGVFIAGTNAATTVTTALTTTFTGNLTGNVGGSVASNTELGPSEVNAQVSAVLKTDTIADLANQTPPATPTFEEALMYVYSALRNKVTVTAGSKGFHNNAGTEIYAKALADDGTIYSEAEGV